jgi:hypothetical protein
VTALLASILAAVAMAGIVLFVSRRRPPGTPLTWGEAFVAALFVFSFMLLVYAIIPTQWLSFADGKLKWRSDKIGIPFGISIGHWHILGLKKPYLLLHKGLRFGLLHKLHIVPGTGKIIITAVILRDIVAALLYVVFLTAQGFAWAAWQKRGKRRVETPQLTTSAYGRPLVRKV